MGSEHMREVNIVRRANHLRHIHYDADEDLDDRLRDRSGRMWPYTIRLNPAGLVVFVFTCLGLYLLYSTTISSEIRHKPQLNLINPLPDDLSLTETVNLKQLLIASIRAAETGGHEVVKVRNSANGLNEQSKGKTREGENDPLTKGDIRSHFAMVHGLSATFPGLRVISEENHANAAEDDVYLDIKPFHINKDTLLYSDELRGLPATHEAPLSELTMWVDPLDATHEYTENLLQYVTTMVCVAQNGRPIIGVIHNPFERKTYWGWVDYGVSQSVKTMVTNRSVNKTADPKIIVSRKHKGDVEKKAKQAFGESVQIIAAGGAGYKTIELVKGAADAYVHVTLIKKWDICAPNAMLDAVGGKMTNLKGETISYSYEDDVNNKHGLLAAFTYTDHEKYLKSLSSLT